MLIRVGVAVIVVIFTVILIVDQRWSSTAKRQELDIFELPGASTYFPKTAAAVPGCYLVIFSKEATDYQLQLFKKRFGAKISSTFDVVARGFGLCGTSDDVYSARMFRGVEYVEQDSKFYQASVILQPPWGLDRIDQRHLPLDSQFKFSTDGGSGVVVYVVDSGVQVDHPEFRGRASEGADLIGDGAADCTGHGTQVAATIIGDNFGVAMAATVVSVRVVGCDRRVHASRLLKGLEWVAQHAQSPSVAIVGVSGEPSVAVDNGVRQLVAQGISVVVPAGNEHVDACSFSPARVPEAITVAASTVDDNFASFSAYGLCVDLVAPGDSIQVPTVGGSLRERASGTSFSAAFVAGVVAVFLGDNSDSSTQDVASYLVSSATTGDLHGLDRHTPNRLLYAARHMAVVGVLGQKPAVDAGDTVGAVGSITHYQPSITESAGQGDEYVSAVAVEKAPMVSSDWPSGRRLLSAAKVLHDVTLHDVTLPIDSLTGQPILTGVTSASTHQQPRHSSGVSLLPSVFPPVHAPAPSAGVSLLPSLGSTTSTTSTSAHVPRAPHVPRRAGGSKKMPKNATPPSSSPGRPGRSPTVPSSRRRRSPVAPSSRRRRSPAVPPGRRSRSSPVGPAKPAVVPKRGVADGIGDGDRAAGASSSVVVSRRPPSARRHQNRQRTAHSAHSAHRLRAPPSSKPASHRRTPSPPSHPPSRAPKLSSRGHTRTPRPTAPNPSTRRHPRSSHHTTPLQHVRKQPRTQRPHVPKRAGSRTAIEQPRQPTFHPPLLAAGDSFLRVPHVMHMWGDAQAGQAETVPLFSGEQHYRSTVQGDHFGYLEGPKAADFDLVLLHRSSSKARWVVADISMSWDRKEAIAFNGPPGEYAWEVRACRGQGEFQLWYRHPI